jgi:hypothetical protein
MSFDGFKPCFFRPECFRFLLIISVYGDCRDFFDHHTAPKGAATHLVIYPKAMMKGAEHMKASIVFECEDVYARPLSSSLSDK